MLDDEAYSFACPDWWEKIQRGETPMPDIPVDHDKAARAVWFFNQLRLPDVAGTPPLSEACGGWFRDIMVAFMCSCDPETGIRIVWELLCMVPKKNSKTTYVAALGLTALYLEEIRNGQMLIIGPSQNIANRCFEQAQGMIRLDEDLSQIFHIQDNVKTISHFETRCKLTVKTFDTGIVTGEIPILTIIDELHELGKKNAAQAVLQQIRGGGITMRGGQVLFITTQSDKRPEGIWRDELKKARAIRDGRADGQPIMLPVLYEFPEALQKDEEFWRNPENWDLILPNLGRSIDRQKLIADYANNGSISPEAEQIWTSQHLNIEIGLGLHSDRWVGSDYWPQATNELIDLDWIVSQCEVVTVGIDPGGHDDLLGLTVIGRLPNKKWISWSKGWADRIVLERRKLIADSLLKFEEQGDLVLVDNLETEGYVELAEICTLLKESDLLPEKKGIGIDGSGKAAGLVIDALVDAGFVAGGDIVPISQGYKLNSVVALTAIKLKTRSLLHAKQEIVDWCVENAKTELSGNAEIITKKESGGGKIDLLMSLFDAAELMSLHPEAASDLIEIDDDYEMA